MEILSELALLAAKDLKRLVVSRALRDLKDAQKIDGETSRAHYCKLRQFYLDAKSYVQSRGFKIDCELAGVSYAKGKTNIEELIRLGDENLERHPMPPVKQIEMEVAV